MVPELREDLLAEEPHGALDLMVEYLRHVDVLEQVTDPGPISSSRPLVPRS